MHPIGCRHKIRSWDNLSQAIPNPLNSQFQQCSKKAEKCLQALRLFVSYRPMAATPVPICGCPIRGCLRASRDWGKSIGRRVVLAGTLRMSEMKNILNLEPTRREIAGDIGFCDLFSNPDQPCEPPRANRLQVDRRTNQTNTKLASATSLESSNVGSPLLRKQARPPRRFPGGAHTASPTRFRVLTTLTPELRFPPVFVRDCCLFAGSKDRPNLPLGNKPPIPASHRKFPTPDNPSPDS